MPAATPQPATRKTRSQSPPQRTQRYPVNATQPAMASSSITPYMWILSGPTSIVPVCGDGMYARSVNGRERILPKASSSCALQQDLQRELLRAALREQADRPVQVHIVPHRQFGRRLSAVPGHLQLLGSPGLHQLGLLADFHVSRSCHALLFGRGGLSVVPLPGDISGELQHLVFGQGALEPERPVVLGPEEHVSGETG